MASERPLDTCVQIVTPENIAFEYRLAGPFRRLPAFVVDTLLVTTGVVAAAAVLVTALSFLGLAPLGWGLSLVIWFVASWFYGGLFETLWNGQTPGKRLARIRVLTVDGEPIRGWQAVLRNVLRVADAMPVFLYSFGLATTFLNDRFQRLGDLACGTMVVVEDSPPRWAVAQIREPAALELAARLSAALELEPGLSQALSTYVMRRGGFSWSRRAEIARHVAEPLRVRLGLPRETSPDILLCAVYHRAFGMEHATTELTTTAESAA